MLLRQRNSRISRCFSAILGAKIFYRFITLVLIFNILHVIFFFSIFSPRQSRTLNILIWNPIERQNHHRLGLGSDIFSSCQYDKCYITEHLNYLPSVDNFDAIIFNPAIPFELPKSRSEHQIYIYENLDPPLETPKLHTTIRKGFFNWTMTYRRDSDVFRPFAFVRARDRGDSYRILNESEFSEKNNHIAWFVSKCFTHSRRDILYSKLARRMPVYVYGDCVSKVCHNKRKCLILVEKRFKYYLAFENSLCKDYVSYHLYDVLAKNVVPIVYGGANYSLFVPERSVIDVFDFKSIDNLVNYIKTVGARYSRYIEYLEWKKSFYVETSMTQTLCQLCKKLHEERHVKKVYEDIEEWWDGKNGEICRKRNDVVQMFKAIYNT